MELIQDHNMCMLNGRGNAYDNSNNFTCISGRGKSVVDYCITPNDNEDEYLEQLQPKLKVYWKIS